MKNKNLFSVLLFLCLAISGKTWAAHVKISGKAPEYAKNSIDLFTLHNFISEEKIKLGTISFNSVGEFNLEIDLPETNLCFSDFDGYHGMIYLEPGKSYNIVFPPKQKLTESQKRNPFFKPEPVWFGISNPEKDELNVNIQQFEQAYANLENKYFDQIFVYQAANLVDTIKQKLEKEFPTNKSIFFESHKLFRKANLDFALHQGKTAGFMETYFSNIKPIYHLAAYSTLFNQVFLNYFEVITNSSGTSELKTMINTGKLQQLDDYFQTKLHFNRELSHFVLLKSMNDAYYSKQFARASILKMLDQVKNEAWSSYEQMTAKLIRSKLTYLASGTVPPTINLKNLNGQKVKFSDFANTYIYLHFTDPKNPICKQHLEALKKIAAHYKDKLTIINVIKENPSFKNEGEWAGIFTTTANDVKDIYRVKTIPTSFLIGKDGRLLLSPAPNPIDGLDRQLGQIFKSDYFKELQQKNEQKIK